MRSEGRAAQAPIFLLVTKAREGARGGWVRCHLGFVPQAPSWAPGSRERANPRSKQQRGGALQGRNHSGSTFWVGIKACEGSACRPECRDDASSTPPRDPLPRRSGRGGLETGTERSCLLEIQGELVTLGRRDEEERGRSLGQEMPGRYLISRL